MFEYYIFEEYIKWIFLRNFFRGCGGFLRLLFNKIGVYLDVSCKGKLILDILFRLR